MKNVKALLDFIRLSVPEKIEFCRNVVTKMKASSGIFSNPDEDLDTAASQVNALETAYIAAQDGGRTATATMHAAEDTVDATFKVLAAYVDRIAKGDETIILLSGFTASKQPVTFQKPELAVENGSNSGSLRLIAKAVDNAGAYIWQMAKDSLPADDSGWSVAGYSTRSNYDMAGLTIASKYYFRVAAITPSGVTDFTTALMKVVE